MNWKTALEGHDSVPEEQRWRCACCDWDHPISLNRLPGHLPLDKFPKRAHNSISAELLPRNLRLFIDSEMVFGTLETELHALPA
ncbi:MAG: hypothetical protein ABSC88_11805 [Terracidiphilus sp.]|jgi:hypothetical protein